MSTFDTLDHCGEAKILTRLAQYFPQRVPMIVGPGDDGAVASAHGRIVMTTDAIVENIDFILGISSGEDIGRKLAVQNLADLAAMGATPRWLLYTAMAPGNTPLTLFEDIARGIGWEAAQHGAAVVGGDLGTARDITLSITALGELGEEEDPVVRSGARPGDVIVLGAPLIGLSAAGLAQVLAENDGCMPDITAAADIAERSRRWHLAPEADLSLGYRFGQLFTSMIDVSDGLVRDGRRLAEASGVSLNLDTHALAPDVETLAPLARIFDTDPWEWVLGSGEEHAMLGTVSRAVWDSHENLDAHFRPIGVVEPLPADATNGEGAENGGGVLLDGAVVKMRGFDHFER